MKKSPFLLKKKRQQHSFACSMLQSFCKTEYYKLYLPLNNAFEIQYQKEEYSNFNVDLHDAKFTKPMQINWGVSSRMTTAKLPLLADAATLSTVGGWGVRGVEIFDLSVNKALHSNSGFICQCIRFEVRSQWMRQRKSVYSINSGVGHYAPTSNLLQWKHWKTKDSLKFGFRFWMRLLSVSLLLNNTFSWGLVLPNCQEVQACGKVFWNFIKR